MALSIQCSIRIISIAIYVLTIHTVATAKATKSVFYNVSHIISNLSYNEQSLIYSIQGIVNKNEEPELFLNTGHMDLDFPKSDLLWKQYFEKTRNIEFDTTIETNNLCSLINHFQNKFKNGIVIYSESDNFTLYPSLTLAGLNSVLPISDVIYEKYYDSCLRNFPIHLNFTKMEFSNKFAMYRWAIDTLLPNCSKTILFNADNYPNAVAQAKFTTIMSVDYAISQRAFIMNLCPLWKCQPKLCGTTRKATPKDTELFIEIIKASDKLVSVFGWSDPEYSYTNITSHAGGAVFCSFSTPNLSYWDAISKYFNVKPLPLPIKDNDLQHKLDASKTYLIFETNEGDTPRILSSQFTSAWVSPNRGSVPIAWAIDPYLGILFPELYNYYANNTTRNDTFINGVVGAGYAYISSLGENAQVYEKRSGKIMQMLGPNVVDVSKFRFLYY